MNSIQAYYSFLEGNSYEVGRRQGEEIQKIPNVIGSVLSTASLDETKYMDMKKLIDQHCPGLNEELQGFADSLNVNPSFLKFYDEALLQPGGGSLGAILPLKKVTIRPMLYEG